MTDLRADQEIQPLAVAKVFEFLARREKADAIFLGKQAIDGERAARRVAQQRAEVVHSQLAARGVGQRAIEPLFGGGQRAQRRCLRCLPGIEEMIGVRERAVLRSEHGDAAR